QKGGVRARGADQNALAAHAIDQFRWGGRVGRFPGGMAPDLDADEETGTANIADCLMALRKPLQRGFQIGAYLPCIRDQLVPLDHIEHGVCGGARYSVPSERVEVTRLATKLFDDLG